MICFAQDEYNLRLSRAGNDHWRGSEQRRWHGEAERRSGFKVEDRGDQEGQGAPEYEYYLERRQKLRLPMQMAQ